jgi:hypothetical protein
MCVFRFFDRRKTPDEGHEKQKVECISSMVRVDSAAFITVVPRRDSG